MGPELPAGMELPDGGFDRPPEGGPVNVGPTLAAGTTLPPEGVEGALTDGDGDIVVAGP